MGGTQRCKGKMQVEWWLRGVDGKGLGAVRKAAASPPGCYQRGSKRARRGYIFALASTTRTMHCQYTCSLSAVLAIGLRTSSKTTAHPRVLSLGLAGHSQG